MDDVFFCFFLFHSVSGERVMTDEVTHTCGECNWDCFCGCLCVCCVLMHQHHTKMNVRQKFVSLLCCHIFLFADHLNRERGE